MNEKNKRTNKTTEEHLSRLLDKLVQTCIDYINENDLKDMDEISFKVDTLQTSANFGYWTPATDAAISAYEVVEDEKGKMVSKFIGECM